MPRRFATPAARLLTLASSITAALALGSGCLIVNDRDDEGDIAFLWSFNGEPNCADAGVDSVVVTAYQGQTIRYEEQVDCVGGGLTIRDFTPGDYDIVLQGLASDDFLLFEGADVVTVVANRTTDMGVIELGRPVNNGPVGEVQFAWVFQYPLDDSFESNCDRAGVIEVDVLLTPAATNPGGETFSRSYNCTDDGVRIEDLPVGEYDLTLAGFGLYNNADIDLFASETIRVVIIENDPDLVGDVRLLRIDENFADIDVNWLLPGNESCANLGITTIQFDIARAGSSVVDDSFTVNCDAAQTEVRENFVPGDYEIDATATGTGGTVYQGFFDANVQPGTTAEVDVPLAAQ